MVSLAADATKETLTLNLIPFIDSSIARPTSQVLGVIAAVLLVISRSYALVGRPRYDAAALLARIYEVDRTKSFTKFEVAGVMFALLSFVHFDLNGHCAKTSWWQRGNTRSIPSSSCQRRHYGRAACLQILKQRSCAAKRFATTASATGTLSAKRRCRTDVWSSEEEHEALPHRQGEEAEAERLL